MNTLIFIILLHWLADFVFQTDEMAQNKSKSFYWLTTHVFTYSLFFCGFGWKFVLITFVCHWITDFVTSKISSYCWLHEKRHNFFVVIGFDQFLHIAQLLLTYELCK